MTNREEGKEEGFEARRWSLEIAFFLTAVLRFILLFDWFEIPRTTLRILLFLVVWTVGAGFLGIMVGRSIRSGDRCIRESRHE